MGLCVPVIGLAMPRFLARGSWAVHEPPLRMGWYGAQLSPARYGQGFTNRPYAGGSGPCVIDAPWAGVSEPWGDYGCGWRT